MLPSNVDKPTHAHNRPPKDNRWVVRPTGRFARYMGAILEHIRKAGRPSQPEVLQWGHPVSELRVRARGSQRGRPRFQTLLQQRKRARELPRRFGRILHDQPKAVVRLCMPEVRVRPKFKQEQGNLVIRAGGRPTRSPPIAPKHEPERLESVRDAIGCVDIMALQYLSRVLTAW